MRRRRRHTRAICVLMTLVSIGFAATTLTTWGPAILGNGRKGWRTPEASSFYPHTIPDGWVGPTTVVRHSTWYMTWVCVDSIRVEGDPKRIPVQFKVESTAKESWGFPFRALSRREVLIPLSRQGALWKRTPNGSWPVHLPLLGRRELPVSPLWAGLALNTLFYAAIAWGLWQVSLALRRRRSNKKGLCVRCGYDLNGIPAGSACPECGSVPRGRG